MNIQDLIAYCRNARRTRSELQRTLQNLIAKGETEACVIVEQEISRRFSGRSPKTAGGTPTAVLFLDDSAHFPNGKDAYIWLVRRFLKHSQNCLAALVEHEKRSNPAHRGARFALNPSELFPMDSIRAGNRSYYSDIGGGWFADTNINHATKFETLMQLGRECGLKYELDWDFKPMGSTDELAERKRAVSAARDSLDRLRSASASGNT